MFERCGIIGEKGLAALARAARHRNPHLCIHLIGHSLGGRAVTACAQSLLTEPKLQVTSMTLLQAAYSQYGLAPRGHFRRVITEHAVKHPILATHSDHDNVVAFAYTAMAALSQNRSRSLDPNQTYGGIGRNGVRNTPEAINDTLLPAQSATYTFRPGHIHNLNGTPLISGHSDIRNPHVTWAVANLLKTGENGA